MPEIDYASLKKNGFMRQRPVEYFSMRLGITGGHVTAEQLAAITEVSKKYGRGYIHLTSRQGIEIPYIEYDDIEAVKSALAEGGVRLGASGPRVRTITACQGNAICLNGCIETQGLAEELRDRYYGRDLPHKFKIGITGCPNNCLKAEENDGKCEKVCKRGAISISDGAVNINASECVNCGKCVRSCPSGSIEGTEGYVVSFGGTFGNRIAQGEVIIPFIEDKARLIAVCDAAMKFFEDNGKAGERLRYTILRNFGA